MLSLHASSTHAQSRPLGRKATFSNSNLSDCKQCKVIELLDAICVAPDNWKGSLWGGEWNESESNLIFELLQRWLLAMKKSPKQWFKVQSSKLRDVSSTHWTPYTRGITLNPTQSRDFSTANILKQNTSKSNPIIETSSALLKGRCIIIDYSYNYQLMEKLNPIYIVLYTWKYTRTCVHTNSGIPPVV